MFNPFKFTPEKQAEAEKPLETEVRLEIFRHSKKENDPNRPNSELLLTPEGRELAHEKGLQMNPDINVSVAGASPMDRTAETAMLIMGANEEKIGVRDSLEEMDKKIFEEIKIGKKIYRDERLGFSLDGPIEAEGMAAFKAGKYMDWLANESDMLAIKKGDLVSTTYLRQAGNIAEMVDKYTKVGNNFNRLAIDKKKTGEEFPAHLERYLATHQSVTEPFLAEVLKEQEGAKARDEFIVDLKNGWAETEGIHINILNKGQEQTIKLTYQDKGGQKEIEVAQETIQKIIRRREIFEEAIKESMNVADKIRV
jgi:hypothetical protein